MSDPAHSVEVPCDCGTIERCVTEIYIADVRIAYRDLDTWARVWNCPELLEMRIQQIRQDMARLE